MGVTMAVEIVGRGNVRISKVLLDAVFLTKLEVVEFDNMGHGQYLHEYSAEYATKFIEYLEA